MINKKDKFYKVLEFGSKKLTPEENERIIAMMRKCIGRKNLLFLANSLRNAYLSPEAQIHPQDHVAVKAAKIQAPLTTLLSSLYLYGAIMFKEAEK